MAKPDVIAAIATGPGRAAIGIVRVSGANLSGLSIALCGRALSPRYATVTSFLDSEMNPIDSGIAIFFPAPHSYTGEDILELQGHGGIAVGKILLARCLELGARLAEPGEFTRRAFLNGKIDLAQAESVADLIEASSLLAARAAVRSLSGVFSAAVIELDEALIEIRTRVEGTIDFPEDEIDELRAERFGTELQALAERARHLRNRALRGKLLRDGIRVAIVGAPNVGKSTLLNILAGEDVAIVTEVAGTTRDPIAADVAFDGVPIHLVDTAGIRDTGDLVEEIGVGRAFRAARDADLLLLVTDIRNPETSITGLPDINRIVVLNKADLTDRTSGPCDMHGHRGCRISAKTGDGINELRQLILDQSGWEAGADAGFTARERHVAALDEAIGHLDAAATKCGTFDLVAEELRLAQVALGHITGQVTADALLGEIFSRFCIGK